MDFLTLSLYFFIYAFCGWCCEVSFATLKTGKFVNRGFLNGPLCPIYGFGCVGIICALTPIKEYLILLFFGSMLLTSLLEFLTGFLLGKLFKQKWWDYSKEPFNIMGYVCLRMSLLWGFACVFVIKLIHPVFESLVSKLTYPVNLIVALVFYAILIADITVSVFQLVAHKKNMRKYNELVCQKFDSAQSALRVTSDKIGSGIHKGTVKSVTELNALITKIKRTRLVKAFPALGEKIGLDGIVNKFSSDASPAPAFQAATSTTAATDATLTDALKTDNDKPDDANA